MQEAFRLGGWGMYPTLFVGIVLVVSAGRYAWNARARLSPIVGLGVLTFFVSTLGFVTGLIKTTISAGQQITDPVERGGAIVTGFGESLVNVGFGLCLLVLATIGVVVGLSRGRARKSGASELVDPLA